MAKRMTGKLIGLSTAGILAVYGAGYVLTQPAAARMASSQVPPPAASAVASAQPQDAPDPGQAPASQDPSPAAVASVAPAAQSSGLKDGSWQGTGWSRHGSVSVAVTVNAGRITAAKITGVTTRYPQSDIAGLPAEVVSSQSAGVDMVSGATDSSMAFQQAVAQALSQAGGGAAAGATTGGATTTLTAPPAAGQPGSDLAPTARRGRSFRVTGPNGDLYRGGQGFNEGKSR